MGLVGQKRQPGCRTAKARPIGTAERNYKCGETGKGKKKCRGASLRGQGSPGFILPASAVSEQENCVVMQNRQNFCSAQGCRYNFFTSGLVEKTPKPWDFLSAGLASTSPGTRETFSVQGLQVQALKLATFLRRRAEIRSVRWRLPLRPTFHRGTR